MMKRFVAVTLSLAIAVLVASPVAAADYTMIVSNADVSTEQLTVVFKEQDILPGFEKSYEIRIENRADIPVRIVLDNIEKITPSVTNLAEAMNLQLAYNGGAIVEGKYNEGQFNSRELLCVSAASNDVLNLDLSLPTTAGNEYQDDSFELRFTFKIDSEECSSPETPPADNPGSPNEPGPPDTSPILPRTGEDLTIFTILWSVISISFVTTIVLLVLVLVAKRRKKDEPAGNEQPQFQSKRHRAAKRKAKM